MFFGREKNSFFSLRITEIGVYSKKLFTIDQILVYFDRQCTFHIIMKFINHIALHYKFHTSVIFFHNFFFFLSHIIFLFYYFFSSSFIFFSLLLLFFLSLFLFFLLLSLFFFLSLTLFFFFLSLLYFVSLLLQMDTYVRTCRSISNKTYIA